MVKICTIEALTQIGLSTIDVIVTCLDTNIAIPGPQKKSQFWTILFLHGIVQA